MIFTITKDKKRRRSNDYLFVRNPISTLLLINPSSGIVWGWCLSSIRQDPRRSQPQNQQSGSEHDSATKSCDSDGLLPSSTTNKNVHSTVLLADNVRDNSNTIHFLSDTCMSLRDDIIIIWNWRFQWPVGVIHANHSSFFPSMIAIVIFI